MANITKYLEKKILAHSVGKTDFDAPTETYVGLFTSAPTVDYTADNPDGVEVTSDNTDYERKEIAWNVAVASTDLTNSSYIKNSDSISWESIEGSYGTVTAIGIFDQSDHLLWFGPLSQPVTLVADDTFTLDTNAITLTLG